MNTIIAKYVQAFHNEKGTPTENIKKILMRYAHSWDWDNSEGLIADLIDDETITADDIVDVLADAYAMDDGNDEFHYAVRAMQVCLRKAQLAEMVGHGVNEEDLDSNDHFEEGESFCLPKDIAVFHHQKYQE